MNQKSGERNSNSNAGFGEEEKRELLGVLADQAQFGGESYLLLTALQYYAAGVRRVGCGEEKETEIPRP